MEMKNTKPSTQFWTVLTTVNVLALIYPIHLLHHAENPGESLFATLAFIGLAFLLTVVDAVSIMIAYAIGSKH
jgi:hypothetical protein